MTEQKDTTEKTQGRARPRGRPRRTRGTSRTHAPVSNAKTAYGLLGEIATLIVAEPARYNQYDVLTFREDGDFYEKYPECGTVGCIAGWAVMLTRAQPRRTRRVLQAARGILGLDEDQSDDLFRGLYHHSNPQTLAHAKAGVKHINKFRQQHRAQLQRTRIARPS